MVSDFVAAKNSEKELEANPARIPPQTPPAGGKSVEAKRKIILSQKKRFSLCRVRIEAQPPARRIEGRDPQKNVLFHLEEKIGRAEKQKSGEHFSAGHASGASGGWADSFVQFPLEKGSRKVYNYSTSSNFLRIKRMGRFLQSKKRTRIFAKTLSAYGGSRKIP